MTLSELSMPDPIKIRNATGAKAFLGGVENVTTIALTDPTALEMLEGKILTCNRTDAKGNHLPKGSAGDEFGTSKNLVYVSEEASDKLKAIADRNREVALSLVSKMKEFAKKPVQYPIYDRPETYVYPLDVQEIEDRIPAIIAVAEKGVETKEIQIPPMSHEAIEAMFIKNAGKASGFTRFKANLTYHLDPDVLKNRTITGLEQPSQTTYKGRR